MTDPHLDPLAMARALNGDVSAGQILCPGPGHSDSDRSLSVKLDKDDPEGFVTHSFAGDDWKACREHVRIKLGLPAFVAKKLNGNGSGAEPWKFIAEYVYRDEAGEPYLKVSKYLDENGKKQYPQSHFENGAWAKGKPPGAKIPYRLPELIAAPLNAPVKFCEGEKDSDALEKLGFISTTASEGAGAAWDPALTPWFRDRHIVILVDADKQGRKHGQKVAAALNGVAASVKVIDLFPDRNDGWDVYEWLKDDRAGSRLAKLVKDAPEWEAPSDTSGDGSGASAGKSDEELIAELAALPKLQYEKRRDDAAKQLGIRVSVLDKLVAEARGDEEKSKDDVLYPHWAVEPSDEPVDGGALLEALIGTIRGYVFLSEDQAVVVALWIVFSWLHEREAFATHSPLLFVTSAERDSGKSTLLGVVNFLARRSLQSVDITGAALFRSLAKWQPTMIIDEADDALKDNIDLRSVINSGWTRGQGVIRCHPDTHEPERFSTFAPKVVGMKGRALPDTTLSRSIVITMKPRRLHDPREATADFSHCDTEMFAGLRSRLMRWAADNAEALAKAEPEVPAAFHNRRRANWVPLLAIAEAGGGGWKEAGEKAALAIEAIADTFDPSIGVQLLRAIRDAFEARAADRISSASLISDLVADETGPWATYNRGKPISQRQVASQLKSYGIRPDTIRIGEGTIKGYLFAWLGEALTRFCSSDTPSTPETPETIRNTVTELFSQENSEFSSVTETDVLRIENSEKPNNDGLCYGVTDRKPDFGEEGISEAPDAQTTPIETCEERIADDACPGEDRTCQQCGDRDGGERPYTVDGEQVWLHPVCHAYRVRYQGGAS
jgi:hypothetical protein